MGIFKPIDSSADILYLLINGKVQLNYAIRHYLHASEFDLSYHHLPSDLTGKGRIINSVKVTNVMIISLNHHLTSFEVFCSITTPQLSTFVS